MSLFIELLGGLGVFLFGLRIMSDGLQKIAGTRLRAILAGLTRNRFAGIFSGFLVTAAVQSSSATTVLVVSFANAGLLTLAQSIGLVMGANIGTTITAWLVALLGFKVKIAAFALPIIGIGFPLSLLNSKRAKYLSEVMIGFGLLFLGLAFLKAAVPDLQTNPEAIHFISDFAGYGFGSTLLFILAGAVVTVIVQSSSATTAIILLLVVKGGGEITFEMAAGFVLGSNLGTTVTATLAAIGANRNATRVARFHTLFNVLGVLLILPFIGPVLAVLEAVIPGDFSQDIVASSRVAAFHTVFNVGVTFVLMGFVSHLEKIVLWLVPLLDDEKEGAHLQFLETGLMGTPELAGLEARRGLQQMLQVCRSMFEKLREVIGNPSKKLGSSVDEIKRGEVKTDEMEEEIVTFCAQLARSATSERVGRNVTTYLEMANDIERMGDFCFNLVKLAERRYEKGYQFGEEPQAEIKEMMEVVAEFLETAQHSLDLDAAEINETAILLEAKCNKLRDQSRKREARSMQEGEIKVREGLIFLDMMTNLEKLGDYCSNVTQASRLL